MDIKEQQTEIADNSGIGFGDKSNLSDGSSVLVQSNGFCTFSSRPIPFQESIVGRLFIVFRRVDYRQLWWRMDRRIIIQRIMWNMVVGKKDSYCHFCLIVVNQMYLLSFE